ncbi:MAG TPA: CoA transferase [Gemmataceae bacterium]|nr:CoA transferase [Gemmataceae bacterium]
MSEARGPLAGIRVVDASRVLAGPFCGQILGDLGAEVLKIERPGSGDETRGWGPPFAPSTGETPVPPLSAYFLSCNRNKRGLTLDLAHPEGRRLFHELARRSDVVLENFRADSANRLGMSPSQLLAAHPRLIVCSISGFGRTSSQRDVPGYDFAIQALSGLMSITGPVDGPPCKVGVAVTDVWTGLYAAVAVLACLQARQRSGHGYVIDLALLDCAVAAQVNVVQAYLTSGSLPARQGNAHLQIVPYQMFATADSWLILAVGNDGQWQRFCRAAERDDLATDERFLTNTQRVQKRDVLVPLVEALMRTRATAAWEELLRAAEVPHAPVWSYADLFAQPEMAERLRVTVRDPEGQPVDLLASPFHITGTTMPSPTAPPKLGQHTEEVLRQLLGLQPEQIEKLRQQGVL